MSLSALSEAAILFTIICTMVGVALWAVHATWPRFAFHVHRHAPHVPRRDESVWVLVEHPSNDMSLARL